MNSQCIKEEIKHPGSKRTRIYAIRIYGDRAKAVLRRKLIVLVMLMMKHDMVCINNLTVKLKILESNQKFKPKAVKIKKIKFGAEINELDDNKNNPTDQWKQELHSSCFKKSNIHY